MSRNTESGLHDIDQIIRNLGASLAQLRLARRFSQEELATRAGLTRRTLSRLETGQSATLDSVVRVLCGLGLEQQFQRQLDALLPAPEDARQIKRTRASATAPQRARSKRSTREAVWTRDVDLSTGPANEGGRVAYAYALMAQAAGISVPPSRVEQDGTHSWFVTKRIDRTPKGRQQRLQTLTELCEAAGIDAADYSYEQACDMIRQHSTEPAADLEQLFLRAIFNVAARNQNDQPEHIVFQMQPDGRWRLAPALKLSFAVDPKTGPASGQRMSINGKRDDFTLDDIEALARAAGLGTERSGLLVEQVLDSVRQWPEFARRAGVSDARSEEIGKMHR